MEGIKREDKFEVKHDERAEKFFIELGKQDAVLVYTRVNNVMDVYMLFIPPEYRYQGLENKLGKAVFEYAKKHSCKIIPTSDFIKEKFLREHKEYKDVLTDNFVNNQI